MTDNVGELLSGSVTKVPLSDDDDDDDYDVTLGDDDIPLVHESGTDRHDVDSGNDPIRFDDDIENNVPEGHDYEDDLAESDSVIQVDDRRVDLSKSVAEKNDVPDRNILSESSFVRAITDGCKRGGSIIDSGTSGRGKTCAKRIFQSLRNAVKMSTLMAEDGEGICSEWPFELPPVEDISDVCDEAYDLLMKDDSLVEVNLPPCYIIGDIHGNFGDLYNFLEKTGLIRCGEFIPAKYVFLGDYIDRGYHDFECVLLLLCLKVLYPKKIFLLRGNHEWRDVSNGYGEESFLYHLKCRYSDEYLDLFGMFMNVFSALSIACRIDNKILCVHGGIPRAFSQSPNLDIIEHYFLWSKPICGGDVPHGSDILSDTLWSDPCDLEDPLCHPHPDLPRGFYTSPRSKGGTVTCSFGMDVLDAFLKRYKLKMLVRAHEWKKGGCHVRNSCKMITVFSTSGYDAGNDAGALLYYDNQIRILTLSNNPDSGLPQSYDV